MSTTYLNTLIKELDKYIRKDYIKHISDFEPEFPRYTKTDSWPKNGNVFEPFIRDYERRSILPAVEKAENAPIVTQPLYEGRTKDVYSVRYATAIAFTYEKLRMGRGDLSSAKKSAKYLADSVRMTMENYYATLLAEAFSTTKAELLGFDGLALCHAAHTLLAGGTHGNLYGSVASPTYGVINEIATNMARMVSEDGYPMPTARISAWWIPPEEEPTILETLKSMGRPDTAVNATNIINQRTTISASTPSGVQTLYYMPATAWFAVDTALHSLTRYTLEAPKVEGPIYNPITQENRWQVAFWISRAQWGWRGIYGIQRA